MIKGISVNELIRKADPVTEPKIAVIRDFHSSEDEETNWATDQLLRGIRTQVPNLQVGDAVISLFNIVPNASNDPDSDDFEPGDQFPLVWDKIREADVAIFSCKESAGFPSCKMVLLLQRMCALARERNEGKEKMMPLLLEPKVAAVVVNGGYGSGQAAVALAGTLNKFGFVLAPHGLASWDYNRGNLKKERKFLDCLDQLSSDIVDLCKAIH